MRYILGVIGVILFTIIAVLIIVGRRPSGTPKTVSQTPKVTMADYIDKPSQAIYTNRGALKGNTDHQEVVITVTNSRRTIDIISGYEGTVVKTNSYPNTPASYAEFINALDKLGFVQTRSTAMTDPSGVCPFGNVYLYTLKNESQTVSQTWAASCASSLGTSAAKGSSIRQLFQQQIPDYGTQVASVKL